MRSATITVRTGGRAVVHDLTDECRAFVRDEASGGPPANESGGTPSSEGVAAGGVAGGGGLLSVFVPHATAGLAIIETGAGSDEDLIAAVDELLPRDARWRHQHGAPGHGRDHVLPAFIAPSITVPVLGGQLQLGTWQSICLVDTNVDNQTREVRLGFLPG